MVRASAQDLSVGADQLDLPDLVEGVNALGNPEQAVRHDRPGPLPGHGRGEAELLESLEGALGPGGARRGGGRLTPGRAAGPDRGEDDEGENDREGEQQDAGSAYPDERSGREAHRSWISPSIS